MAAPTRSSGEMFVSSLQRKRTTLAFIRKVGKEEECSICVNKFEINEYICILECGHMFHHHCLAPWLLNNSTCPLCRRTLYENGGNGYQNGGIGPETSWFDEGHYLYYLMPSMYHLTPFFL
ncbi:hypothetical protein POM88_043851 [Heracleum sosnowskyi]|nr:hypothetical protein POM88_043851 [Heracleum sosnowskyi]